MLPQLTEETKERIAFWAYRGSRLLWIVLSPVGLLFFLSFLIGWPFRSLALSWPFFLFVLCQFLAVIVFAKTSAVGEVVAEEAKRRKIEATFAEQLRAAQWGNLEAMVYVGTLYMYPDLLMRPRHIKADLLEAEQWFQRATQKRYPRAYYWLGMLYLKQGRTEEAKAAINTGVQAGDVPAIGALGRMYLSDKYYPKDTNTAIRLLETAANLEMSGRGRYSHVFFYAMQKIR